MDRPVEPAPHARTTIVVPCYDEAARLDAAAFLQCAREMPGVEFLFVDDGSSDGTRAMLEALCQQEPTSLRMLVLPANGGKAEAVRQGVLAAAEGAPAFVGYWDADLSTPLSELPGFVAELTARPEIVLVLGSRVNLLGRRIRRRLSRHYLGRIFATFSGALLRLPVYDTQCGAKVLRCEPEIVALFADRFRARWVFDIELLARLIEQRRQSGSSPLECAAVELPLHDWHDVEGSKVGAGAYLGAMWDVVGIAVRHRAIIRRRDQATC